MNYVELSKGTDEQLYPDIVEARGLPLALSMALENLASPLKATSAEDFIPYARVAEKSRFSQMYLAAHERLFLFDFWSQGVLYANAACENLTDAAKAIHFWIAETPTIADMEKRFSFFRPTDEGKAHEAGQAVEYEWESLLNRLTELEEDMSDESISLRPLIEAARRRPELRQLFPYMSLDRLCFSRTTGYPFTSDCPRAVAMENGRYRVYSAKPRFEKRRYGGGEYEEAVYEVIGEGNVEEVINMLVANLPPNCGAAVSGTAEDLNRTTEEELEN